MGFFNILRLALADAAKCAVCTIRTDGGGGGGMAKQFPRTFSMLEGDLYVPRGIDLNGI